MRWEPWETAPKDGRWIIASCWDGFTLKRVSWGRDRQGELRWCSVDKSYGDGLFGGWIECPQKGPAFIVEPADVPGVN